MNSSLGQLKQQLQALIERHQQGAVPTSQYETEREVLERAMVAQVMTRSTQAVHAPDALSEPDPSTRIKPRQSPWLVVASATFTLLVAVGGYGWKGSPSLIDPQALAAPQAAEQAAQTPGSEAPVNAEQFAALVEKLRLRLQNEPDNGEGWTMLARAYTVLGQAREAVDAYARAVALVPGNAALLADYADMLAVTQDRSLEGEPARLIDRALAINPDEPKALSLAGALAFDRKDYAAAVALWERILQKEPEHPFAPQLQESLVQARQLGNLPSIPTASGGSVAATGRSASPPASATSSLAARITGTASLAPELAGRVQPDHTVFVFARAAEGSRMPLAMVRKTVKDLPFDFTLDDSSAMSPQSRLSGATQVVVGVRISASGNATPQPGDLQGYSPTLSVDATGVRVTVSDVVGK